MLCSSTRFSSKFANSAKWIGETYINDKPIPFSAYQAKELTMKRNPSILLAIFLIGIVWMGMQDAAFAQSKRSKRTFGLAAAVGTNSSPGYIMLPIWVSRAMVLAPLFSLNYQKNSATDFGAGAAMRFYTRMARIAPYFGFSAAALIYSPAGGSGSTTDFVAAALLGAEFFLHYQFSLAVQAQLNGYFPADTSTRWGAAGAIQFATAMVVLANIYF